MNIGKTKFENLKVSRGCQHGEYRSNFETFWRGAHTDVVHVGVLGKGSTQNTRKVVSEQGDGRRMDDVRAS